MSKWSGAKNLDVFQFMGGQKDVGVEYEPGTCNNNDRAQQQSANKAFDLPVDLCSPAGQKL